MKYLGPDVLKSVYKQRPPESHKGDFGNLLIIGGSNIYTGSPALVAMAALRAGADLTCIAAPRRAADIAAGFSQNIITCPLVGEVLTERNINTIMGLLPKYDAVVIGNGIGLDARTKAAVLKFLRSLKKPCVVDADAIKMLVG
ncbi:MAG: NAD(P)H-hydrate dehydratase [Candidatus Aenigmatarchaeota archaeon]